MPARQAASSGSPSSRDVSINTAGTALMPWTNAVKKFRVRASAQ